MPYWSLRAGGTTSRPVASLMPPREVEPGRDEFQGILLEIQLGVGFLLGDFFMGWETGETGVFMGLEWDSDRDPICDVWFVQNLRWMISSSTNQPVFQGRISIVFEQNTAQMELNSLSQVFWDPTWGGNMVGRIPSWSFAHQKLGISHDIMRSHDITMQPATNGDMHVYYEILHHHDKHNVCLLKKMMDW